MFDAERFEGGLEDRHAAGDDRRAVLRQPGKLQRTDLSLRQQGIAQLGERGRGDAIVG